MQTKDIALASCLALMTIFAVVQTIRLSNLQVSYTELDLGAERSLAKATIALNSGEFDASVAILNDAKKTHPELSFQSKFQHLLNRATALALRKRQDEREIAERRRLIAAQEAEKEKRRAESKGLAVWNDLSKELSPGFDSTNIESLYGILSNAMPAPKDQFETNDDYNNRLEKAFQKMSLGLYSIQDSFLFSTDGTLSLTYDPSKKAYEVRMFDSVDVEQNETADGTYEGQNAFGVRKEITKSTLTSYSLQLSNTAKFKKCKDFVFGSCVVDAPIYFPFPPDQARLEGTNLRVVYIVKLMPPFVTSGNSTTQATISNPTEMNYQNYVVHGELEQFRIVSSSGKTLFELPR